MPVEEVVRDDLDTRICSESVPCNLGELVVAFDSRDSGLGFLTGLGHGLYERSDSTRNVEYTPGPVVDHPRRDGVRHKLRRRRDLRLNVKQEAAEVTYFERVRPNQVSDSTYPEKGPAYIAPGDIEIEPTEDGWVGRSPSVIDGVENPYLELREGEEYTFVLVDTADLEVFQIMGGGEIIDDYELDLVERDGAARLEFVATDQMEGYSSRFLSGRLRVGAPAMISS